jgi:hypothetical protein
MSRYEELDRKAYSLLGASIRCAKNGSRRFSWMWMKKYTDILAIRDALTIEEAESPAINPKMGKYAFI